MSDVISIVNYGSSNVGSIINMLNRLAIPNEVVDRPEQISKARKLILPGVGSFDNGIKALQRLNLIDPIREFSQSPTNYLLGICLGMQLLGNSSQEGQSEGLGIISGRCFKFDMAPPNNLKVPHMCWNYISLSEPTHPLTLNLPSPAKFYFVHSYHFVCTYSTDIIASTHYGTTFSSIVGNSNSFGCQFHPEKSHKFGLQLFSNFAKLNT